MVRAVPSRKAAIAKTAARPAAKATAVRAKSDAPTRKRGSGKTSADEALRHLAPVESPKRKVTDCQIINSLARGLKVLSAFSSDDATLSNKDLAVRTGLPKPTVSRLTSTLVRLNFLVQDTKSGAYRLGEATLALGVTASANIDLPHVAQPFMQAFAEEHNVGICLGVRDGIEIRALAYSVKDPYNSARGTTGAHRALAARQPLGTSGIGYALLAAMSLPERAVMFDQLAAHVGRAAWPNMHRRIQFAIEDIDRYGYCASIREWDRTLNSAAVPISFSTKGVPLSLACMMPVAELPESRIRKTIGPALVDLTQKIHEAFERKSGQSRFS